MEAALEQFAESSSETFWMLHWYEHWQARTHALAMPHLTAYVQETCYWTAQKLTRMLPGQQSVADLFQTAIAHVEKVLKGFNPQLSVNLKSYAECRFASVLKNVLRQQREASFCTDWFLLHSTSKKRLVEALQQFGESPATIQNDVLVWRCFQECYVPQTSQQAHKLAKPNSERWQAIATAYNAERLSHLGATNPAATPEWVEKRLLHCAKAIRAYQLPAIVSVDAPLPGQESGDLLDNLPDDAQATGLTELITQEEQTQRANQQKQMTAVIQTAIAELDETGRSLLQLYYQQGLTQQQIAQTLDIKQYTVSRQLSRLRQKLLLALANWSQQTLHIALTSGVLDGMSDILEEWLKIYYSSQDINPQTAGS
jgi:RNA polymerase sigma factor (sigma-70 family)